MTGYILRRVLLFIPTLLLISVLVYGLLGIAPGDAADIMAEDATEEVRAAIREDLGLNDPLPVQYVRWLGDLVTGDLGESVFTGRSVVEELRYRMPVTLEVAALALFMTAVLGIPIGMVSAIRPEGWLDQVLRGLSILALSVPLFWVATLLLVLPSVQFGYSPPPYYMSLAENWSENLRLLVPVAFVLALSSVGRIARIMRTTMLDVLHQDYIRTARAKGLRSRIVFTRHAARNALIPVVTVLALQVPYLFGGVVIAEVVFGVPGIGSFLYDSINTRDVIVALNLDMVIALIVLTTNLLVDLSYGWLDPRIRL
jgi:peptide/nickel transport system permease protein